MKTINYQTKKNEVSRLQKERQIKQKSKIK